ncbi:hypothetical protein L3Q82_008689 [Scortum barcoo]|uniref:Uncharacterized protein n=1 Tax=Scortum barcoo TaxID=214431 RepID=A0ACB8XCC1_9TELE|nr:hypothetical protein L3Q82_008689 [Scortum barcoo]
MHHPTLPNAFVPPKETAYDHLYIWTPSTVPGPVHDRDYPLDIFIAPWQTSSSAVLERETQTAKVAPQCWCGTSEFCVEIISLFSCHLGSGCWRVAQARNMALNFQTSTLSLTLPISCQICLGKVRQPVICANHHVFCSSCMQMWLKKASQCPTCRVPITADNPCREIIGGTNESDHSDSPSMRKCLRKTRGELLLREYEEEIEGLIRENEELKTKNQILESQLKTALDPSSINTMRTDDRTVDPYVLEEWTNKLRAATDVCDKVKQDMDKLKEANKALRSQNVDLVQENMRLKAEVASRSPQKFGRYTVAALEAKIQQYEREVDHLKRALERSDQYVEDLESQLRKSEKRCPEVPEACGVSKAGSEDFTQQQKINMMIRSLSDNERESICSNPEADCRTFSRNHSLTFHAVCRSQRAQ